MDKKRKTLYKKFSKTHNNKLNAGCIKKVTIKERIGSPSVYGEVYKACYPLSCKYKLAVKKIPLRNIDDKYIKEPESKYTLNKSVVFSELFFLKLTNILVDKNICPHLPLVYEYSICNKCEFKSDEIKDRYPENNCILVVNELANGDLKMFLTETMPTLDEVKIAYFQIYMGIYCIRKYYNIYHNDLHWGNVLFHKIPKGGYIKYIIKKKEIIIPNIGYLMVLWDFGLSFIPQKIEASVTKKMKYNDWDDYKRITTMLYKDEEQKRIDYHELGIKLLNIMEGSKNPVEFVLMYGMVLNTGAEKKDIIATYNTDKKLITTDKNIKKYTMV